MSALAAHPVAERPAAGETIVVGAEIAAGHDGAAELVVSLRYHSGVVAPVVLDGATGLGLMKACGAASLDALTGRSWRDILKGL
jgi:hypothetical protein